MKRKHTYAWLLALLFGLMLGSPVVASAAKPNPNQWRAAQHTHFNQLEQAGPQFQQINGGQAHSVPELDPKTAGAALTLFVGGALVIFGHRRREQN